MNKLRVFYGYAKLTKKAVRKRQLVIFFENYNSFKNETWLEQKMHIVHVRPQTEAEASDAKLSNRMFTKYGTFIDDKPWLGDIELVLENNFNADSSQLDMIERQEIRDKLRKAYYKVYNIDKKLKGQQNLIFN